MKEEPTSEEAQREGLQDAEAFDFSLSEEGQQLVSANPELKTLIEQLVKSTREVAAERNQQRTQLEQSRKAASEMES